MLLSPPSTIEPLVVVNSTALSLVLSVLNKPSLISPSAAITIWPEVLKTPDPSAISTAPPFELPPLSAVIVIEPFSERIAPNSPITTSC